MGIGNSDGYVIPTRYWRWAGTGTAVRVWVWLVAAAIGGHHLHHARTWFMPRPETPESEVRADGNGGHVQIDFGGQWVMGRMLATGNGHELYHRQRQWEVVRAGFPVADEAPASRLGVPMSGSEGGLGALPKHDADNMMYWFMGTDPVAWKTVGGAAVAPLVCEPLAAAGLAVAAAEAVTPGTVKEVTKPAIGGPLYPPVHGVFYLPLGCISRPQIAYAIIQYLGIAAAYFAGFAAARISGGRVWASAAAIVILLFPGCRQGLDLGQNPTITLAVVLCGWALLVGGRDLAGGFVWSLLAYKPVWAVAFLIVPLLMGRWRFLAGMVAGGLFWIVVTLPFVGVQSWFDWLEVGNEAATTYNVNKNWIMLSRDLHGIPRRILHDFNIEESQRDTVLAKSLAWSLWGVVFTTTVVIARWRFRYRAITGPFAAFLFFGAFLTCYRFMYYDLLLALGGIAVLLADPGRFRRTYLFSLDPSPASPTVSGPLPTPTSIPSPLSPRSVGYLNSIPLTLVVGLLVWDNVLLGANLQASLAFGYFAHASDGTTVQTTPKVLADTSLSSPGDTLLVLGLWAWCGLWLIMGPGQEDQSEQAKPTPVGSAGGLG